MLQGPVCSVWVQCGSRGHMGVNAFFLKSSGSLILWYSLQSIVRISFSVVVFKSEQSLASSSGSSHSTLSADSSLDLLSGCCNFEKGTLRVFRNNLQMFICTFQNRVYFASWKYVFNFVQLHLKNNFSFFKMKCLRSFFLPIRIFKINNILQ